MKVLFISPEVGPIVRAGGLGDVVGALPIALKEIGIDVRIICPLHRESKVVDTTKLKTPINLRFGTKSYSLNVKQTELGNSGIPVYLLENKFLFDRPGIYADENGNYLGWVSKKYLMTKPYTKEEINIRKREKERKLANEREKKNIIIFF